METKITDRASFSVIGREGSTDEGAGFIQRLWGEANANFNDIAALVKKNVDGVPCGFWGAMSDLSRSFMPWEDGFSRGLYLAGAEVNDDAQAPQGWVKWTLPAHKWLFVAADDGIASTFAAGLEYIEEHGWKMAGAACDFNDPAENGRAYTAFPIEAKD